MRATQTANCSTSSGEPGYCLSAAAVCRCAVEAVTSSRVRDALEEADTAQRNADRTAGGMDVTALQFDQAQKDNARLRTKVGRYQVATMILGLVALSASTYIVVDEVMD